MTNMELMQDINLLMQYINQMKDAQKPNELNRIHSMTKKKLEEVYKDKKKELKNNR